MPRQTKSEINDEILDCAAGLFGRQGFARTSIQQVAEALNYSKAGLLHHYPSKKALYEAVLDKYESKARERIAELESLPAGLERDRRMIEGSIEQAFKWPGMIEFGHFMVRDGLSEEPRFVQLGLEVISSFGIDFDAPDLERMTRAFSALAGISFSARIAKTMKMEREFRDHIRTAAMDALGHGARRPVQKVS
ncbi:TetR/AcrR family transcriptional regulator [Sphingosinicella rhizophila]|uniref:TetR/AcrR family transcriptional regulator n=1 Tax=Sphingosinicella rhizophila TaxID=3050082 RepID=A0ABU3Q608_9SPHN|nr:TetR/AcrR family transcriptional regulator [Sphingosinicella sp. GR2756]MDT9598830.1 TetR/AcrR family transcriptional regulator [Sphingosinicella sp. GR2756]